jgi:hypothetical protein
VIWMLDIPFEYGISLAQFEHIKILSSFSNTRLDAEDAIEWYMDKIGKFWVIALTMFEASELIGILVLLCVNYVSACLACLLEELFCEFGACVRCSRGVI